MNSKLVLVLRIIFGLWLILFGANHVFVLFEPPPPPTDAVPYWEILTGANVINMVGIVEMIAGLSLLLNKYAALMMLIMMSVSVNAIMYHIHLDHPGMPMGAVMLALNIIMLFAYKDRYKELLNG